jgi:uncharacterized protein YbgA (DUF1722 family)
MQRLVINHSILNQKNQFDHDKKYYQYFTIIFGFFILSAILGFLVVMCFFPIGVFKQSSSSGIMITSSGPSQNAFSGMPALTENDIIEYVKERFEEVKQDCTMGNLVTFHSNNKYLLLAHNQEKVNALGNIVANHKKIKTAEVIYNYENCLIETLNCTPTVKTHTNVLMHIFGFFGKFLNQKEKKTILRLIKQYRKNQVSLGQVLDKIEPITYQFNNMYLVSQTYFLLYADSNNDSIFEKYENSHPL